MITRRAVRARAVVTGVLGWLALWLEPARAAALSAAQQGLAAAKVAGLRAGESRAAEVAASLGGIGSPEASGSARTRLSVVVTGVAPSLVPGLPMTVREAAAGPAEVFGA